MKLLTLNSHSHIEENYPQKLAETARWISAQRPDIIALQEVNQRICDAQAFSQSGIKIRTGNHVLSLSRLLERDGLLYDWRYLPIKCGYGIYEEGVAVMSLSEIRETRAFTVSSGDDFSDFRTRKILGIKTSSRPDWFFSVHYGWWGDSFEPFRKQWERTLSSVGGLGRVWLMGDFNSPAEVRCEGYDLVSRSGFFDTYLLATEKDGGKTVKGAIDGWRNGKEHGGMRIDQIWVNEKMPILKSRVVFDGVNGGIVSDHYGVMIEYEE